MRKTLARLYYPLYRAGVRVWCAYASVDDRLAQSAEPYFALPPAHLRFRVAGDPSAQYFIDVGRNTVRDLAAALDGVSPPLAADARILDFGCGCGRTLIPLQATRPDAALFGVDTDPEAIAWCRSHLAFGEFLANSPEPPLPFEDATFDLIYAVSVFTHLDRDHEQAWLAELRRILKPGGVALLTVYGRTARLRLGEELEKKVQARGIVFEESRKLEGIFPRWYQTCLRSEKYVQTEFGRHFKLEKVIQEGLGEMDLIVCRLPEDSNFRNNVI